MVLKLDLWMKIEAWSSVFMGLSGLSHAEHEDRIHA
jgi:hypothetical protein